MTNGTTRMHSKLKLAAVCIVLGLIVEASTLSWSHPTSFIVFATVGVLLIASGIVIYLTAIVRQ